MSRLHNMLPFRRTWLGIALLSSARVANAAQSYCSSQNTGSGFSSVFNIYQSNGACADLCRPEYAFAVVQFQTCWCSNFAPGSQTGVSNCNQDCPGFPSEQCGNINEGLYGYIALVLPPSGTAGGSSASSTTSSTTSSTIPSSTNTPTPSSTREEQETSIVSSTVVQTMTQSISQTIRTTQTSLTIQTSQTSEIPSSRTTSRPSTTSSPPEPTVEPVTTTVSGVVVTQFITTTPSSEANENVAIEHRGGLSAGAVAGIVIGVVAGLAVLAIAAFLLWRRKKNAEVAAIIGSDASGDKKNMSRNVSVLSKAGLLSRGAQPSMGERETDDAFGAGGTNGRHSMLFGPGAEGVSPTSPLGSSHGDNSSTRRMSKPMVYDQRLNPSALFSNSEANGSRISMQDTQDYSRPLGVTNPDPRPSFESRTSNYRP